MGKTIKGKDKAARKTAAAKRKIARKCKGGKVAAIVAAFALVAILTGCTTADSAQPAKSQTQENRFDGCTFVMAAKTTISNGVIVRRRRRTSSRPLTSTTTTRWGLAAKRPRISCRRFRRNRSRRCATTSRAAKAAR